MTKRPQADSSVGACLQGRYGWTGRGSDGQAESGDCHARTPAPAWRHEPAARHDDRQSDSAGSDTLGDSGGLAVLVGGFAAAAGEVALATGVVETVLQDRPGLSIAWGGVSFEAHGYAQQPSDAFAVADTWLQILGADLVMCWSTEESGCGADNAWAYSGIDYLAIDVETWSPARPLVIELYQETALPTSGVDALSGSYAAVVAAVEAHRADTLALTSTYAFTESQLSFVHAMALALA
jgi:hypothetical protein